MYQMHKSNVPKTRPAQKEGPDLTGIPKQMKLEFEERFGAPLDDVRVQYNSEKPAQLKALAYTQGSRIYIAPGQERHLRHELVHVIQQKQGRVQATARVNGMAVNDEERLEREADLGQVPAQMKAGAAGDGVAQAIKEDGHLGGRTKLSGRMYNNKAYRWSHYWSQKEQGGNHVGEWGLHVGEGALHHIIPHDILEAFWDIIVDYYPDLWGDMVKTILKTVNGILRSGDPVYHSDYQNQLLVAQDVEGEEIEKEIDREAGLLEKRAFHDVKIAFHDEEETLFAKRPENMEDIQLLIGAAYSWMPGNLVIGPLPKDRNDDPDQKSKKLDGPGQRSKKLDGPGQRSKRLDSPRQESEELDTAALWQKGPKQYGLFKDLYTQMMDFIGKQDNQDKQMQRHNKRRNVKILKLYGADEEIMKADEMVADEMETKARNIICGIVSLLAGQNVTNSTVWKAEKKKNEKEEDVKKYESIRLGI